jgi:hypothetical protein
VRSLRSAIEPPPPWPQSTRLAVDVWLASSQGGSPVAGSSASPRERLSTYRSLYKAANTRSPGAHVALADVRALLAAKARDADLLYGPCYLPLG